MSYWSYNPELYDEIIFKEMVARGLCNEEDDIQEVIDNFKDDPRFTEIAIQAERNYWADKMDGGR